MKFTSKIDIRFRDLDALGHVNNAVYLTYVEQARIDYFKAVLHMKYDWTKWGLLLARTEINYLQPALLHHILTCQITCVSLGNKSMEFQFEIFANYNQKITPICNGKNILVCYDHIAHTSMPIPNEWKTAIEDYQSKTI